MEALAASSNVQVFLGEKDKVPEGTYFVEVELDCIVPDQLIPGVTTSYMIGLGKSTVTVTPKDLAALHRMQEDAALVATAKAQYELDVDAAVFSEMREVFRNMVGDHGGPFTLADVTASRKRFAASPATAGQRDIDINAAREKLLKTSPLSWQGTFQRLNHRGVNPLIGIKVLDDKVVHPEEARRQRFMQDQSLVSAKALREVLEGVGGKGKAH